ncbi:MAG TPA: glycosyltransferase family 39 protein [Acidimicrobiales bacterium]|nr:glycosyltransferase family 39 protein [Acidimicrobiales bacterium]
MPTVTDWPPDRPPDPEAPLGPARPAGEPTPATRVPGGRPEEPPGPAGRGPTDRRGGWVRRFLRGRPADPAWVRPCLLGLLAATAVLYLWDLGASGWANSFYAAAVQAGSTSWKAFFFGSFDASNFITVDKPPGSLWVMDLSARLFGVNAWSILVPQALEGVASVGVLYLAVRRWSSAGAGLLAGAVLALTPVAALMFRFDNPDALLVLLLVAAAYAVVRAVDGGRTGWLVLAGSLVGLGFLTKMLQALIVVPVFAAVYLLAGPPKLGRRLWQMVVAGVAVVVAGGWWVAAVQLTPAADRPYIGGSQDNNLFNLIFGYNGFGRLTGNESGSVGGSPGGGSQWGPTGWDRLFLPEMGGQISWLIPAAVVLLVAVLWLTWRAPRRDRLRAAVVLWGGWLLLTGLLFSYADGIIHPYYTVALAPAVAALVGIGTAVLWRRRDQWFCRLGLGLALAATAVWGFVLLDRSPTWYPWLRWVVLVGGLAVAAGVATAPRLRGKVALAVGTAGVVLGLAAPAAYSLDTVATPHGGSIPSAGPTTGGGFPGGGPGGGGGFPGGGPGAGGGGFPGGAPGGTVGGGTIGGGTTGGFPGGGLGQRGSFAPPGAGTAGGQGSTGQGSTGRPGTGRAGGFPGGGGFGGGQGGGAAGGLLNGSTPDAALTRLLSAGAGRYRWVAATVGANAASGYQLATGDPVMAIGGFNGTDPAPSLAQFEQYVRQGKIHWFIAGGGGFGGGGGGFGGAGGTGTGDASRITAWVESHYTAKTVGGVTVYDLTAR